MEQPTTSPKLAEAIAEIADELIERQETRQDNAEQAIAEVADELIRRIGAKERIQPVVGGPLPPADPTITEEDIDRANARFDDLLPEFAGLLSARASGRKAKESTPNKFVWEAGDLVIDKEKGSAASGNWLHSSFNRVGVGRGGSDPSGTGGSGLAIMGLDADSTPEERRAASEKIRQARDKYGVGKPPEGDNPTKERMADLHEKAVGWPPTTEKQVATKRILVDDLAQRAGVDPDDVDTMLGVWMATSNDHSMTALTTQQVVAEEMGVPMSAFSRKRLEEVERRRETTIVQVMAEQQVDREQAAKYVNPRYTLRVPEDRMRKVAHAMYEKTQETMREAGYKPGDMVRLYRGVSLEKGGPSDNFRVGDIVPIIGNAAGSWTTGAFMAHGFAKPAKGWNGIVFSLDVPVERVFSTFVSGLGSIMENELVILGGFPGDLAQVEKVRPATKGLDGLIERAKALFDNLLSGAHGELDLE